MAHDFDFKPVTSRPKPTPHHTPVRVNRLKKRSNVAPLMLAIFGLAAAAIGAYYWASQPPKATAPAVSTDTAQELSGSTTENNKNVFQKTDELVVQVYESGASQEIIDQTLADLKEKGFTTENLGKSQFEYDKTYIWHTAEYTEKAKEVGALLTGRVVSYKESQNAGLFDILIYLGKQ